MPFDTCKRVELGKGLHGITYYNENNTVTKVFYDDKILKHEFVVSTLLTDCSFVPRILSRGDKYLIFEYKGCNLFDVLEQKLPYNLKSITRQLLYAISGLHNRGIAHLDIKLENVLVKDGQVSVCDFGLSERMTKETLRTSSMKGPRGSMTYICPEMFTSNYNAIKADFWSLGTIIFALAYGIFPFQHAHQEDDNFKKFYAFLKAGTSPYLALKQLWRNHMRETMDTWWLIKVLDVLLHPDPEKRCFYNGSL